MSLYQTNKKIYIKHLIFHRWTLAHTLSQLCHLLMENANSIYFPGMRLPVNGWLSGEKNKNRSTSFSDWNRFSLRFRKCTPLATQLNVLLRVLSVLHGQEGGKKGMSPFSCSATSLNSGNLDPTMLWLRISLCSCKHTHMHTLKQSIFSLSYFI